MLEYSLKRVASLHANRMHWSDGVIEMTFDWRGICSSDAVHELSILSEWCGCRRQWETYILLRVAIFFWVECLT
jgi:hypothetical protein